MAAQGWCPSTYRLHDAHDGPLARVKVPGGVLTVAQLRAAADAARRFGNGVVELTNRANLQLRGVDADGAEPMRAGLRAVGLTAPTAEIEDRRNVLASPTAGLADDEVLDVRPVVAAVVAALDALPADPPPPHKVGVLVDGGGAPTLRDIPMDLALGAVPAEDGPTFEVALGGPLDRPGGPPLRVRPDAVADLAAAAVGLAAAPPDSGPPARVADLVERGGADALLAALAPHLDRRPVAASPSRVDRRSAPHGRAGRGWTALRPTDDPVRGDALAALADAVDAAGGDHVRLTPWRSVILPGSDRSAAGWRVVAASGPVTTGGASTGAIDTAAARHQVPA